MPNLAAPLRMMTSTLGRFIAMPKQSNPLLMAMQSSPFEMKELLTCIEDVV